VNAAPIFRCASVADAPARAIAASNDDVFAVISTA
jgi:hypothetical protein